MNAKLLVIEDDRFIHELLKEKFDGSGIEVFFTEKGKRGYEIAKKEVPDVILVDLILPDIDGVELIKMLKSDVLLKNTKIVVTTNLNKQNKIDEVMKLGVSEYYIKSNESFFGIVDMIKSYFK